MKPTAFDIVPDVALDLDALDVEELEPRLEFCDVCGIYQYNASYGRTIQIKIDCGCL